MRRGRALTLSILAVGTVGLFQNCSGVKFESPEASKLSAASVAAYVTDEDTPIFVDLIRDRATISSVLDNKSGFSVTRSTQHGALDFNTDNATFTYTPDKDFFGEDGFDLAEIPAGESQAITRTIYITVRSVDDAPVILTDVLNFDMNSVQNPVVLDIKDIDDGSVRTVLSADGSQTLRDTTNGRLEVKNGQVVYTPNRSFRGVEQVEMWALDPHGVSSSKFISFAVGNPFRDFRPALAIRGSGCVSCHATVKSPFVTDLGFGNSWFAGQDKPASYSSSSNLLSFTNGNIYGDHGGSSWSTAKISGDIVVPKTNAVVMTGNSATTLAQYLAAVEANKAAPAKVVEKDSVYIGAPTTSDLEARFAAKSSDSIKFIPNDNSSPNLTGVTLDPSGYYRNSGVVTCDGDVFLRGTLFLDNPVIATKNGCRLHATGPIFFQGSSTYQNLGGVTAANNTNLQLVSARAILLGIGLSHCETQAGQWYFDTKISNPLKERLQDIWTTRSHVTRLSQDPRTEGAFLLAEAAKIANYKDASCYAGGRNVHLERILLNAPMIQSRMTGNVSGVVITEVALFALSKFAYEFDDVFTRVPVLPLLNESDFLVVK